MGLFVLFFCFPEGFLQNQKNLRDNQKYKRKQKKTKENQKNIRKNKKQQSV